MTNNPKKNEKRPNGLEAISAGLIIRKKSSPDILYSPSAALEAEIGINLPSKIKKDFMKSIYDIKQGNLDPNKYVLLTHCAQTDVDFEDLRAMVSEKKGTEKLLTWSALRPVNKKGDLTTYSSKNQAGLLIESRRTRAKHNTPVHVQIYDPQDLSKTKFTGGTRFSEVLDKRGYCWNDTINHEAAYLHNLTDRESEQLTQGIDIVEYSRACAHRGLEELLITGKKISGSGTPPSNIELPFNLKFDEATPEKNAILFEILLSRYLPANEIRHVTNHPTGELKTYERDMMFYGLNILSDTSKKLLETEKAYKGIIPKRGHIPMSLAPIIQSFETYLLKETDKKDKELLKYNFTGYTLEFIGTPHQMVSEVFNLTPEYKEKHPNENYSARIIYGNSFKLPLLLFADYNESLFEKSRNLGNRKITNMINFHSGKDWKGHVRRFKGIDWMTGKKTTYTIREPKPEILDLASSITYMTQGKIEMARDMRGWYIQDFKKRR